MLTAVHGEVHLSLQPEQVLEQSFLQSRLHPLQPLRQSAQFNQQLAQQQYP